MSRSTLELPRTLGLLRKSSFSEARLGSRTVKDELRTRPCRGKAYFTMPYTLGQYLLMDYMNRTTRTVH